MRLFIAIELSNDIKMALGRLRTDIPGARWVSADQIHLTLAFLGEVDEVTTERLTGELSHIRTPEFKLRFRGTGCFPDRHRPRVLWVGLKPEPRLNLLAASVRSTVLNCGIPQEERTFSPHLTLARLKLPASKEAGAFIDQHTEQTIPPLAVREFVLYQSRLSQKGAEHAVIKRFPLAAEH